MSFVLSSLVHRLRLRQSHRISSLAAEARPSPSGACRQDSPDFRALYPKPRARHPLLFGLHLGNPRDILRIFHGPRMANSPLSDTGVIG